MKKIIVTKDKKVIALDVSGEIELYLDDGALRNPCAWVGVCTGVKCDDCPAEGSDYKMTRDQAIEYMLNWRE